MLAACAWPGAKAAAPEPGGIAGTYEVVVCQDCGPGRSGTTLARGHLVLEAEPYPFSDLPERVRAYVERRGAFLARSHAGGMPNACFVLARTDEARGRTMAGTQRVGVTRWEAASGGGVALPLFHGPDAGYRARLSIRGRELRGRGETWDAAVEEGSYAADSIFGRRIGPPDRARCIRAVEAAAAEAGGE